MFARQNHEPQNWLDAVVLAKAANPINKEAIQQVEEAWPEVRRFVHANATGILAWNDDTVVIAIAGTNDFADILQDLDVRPVAFGLAAVARAAYLRIRIPHGFREHTLQVKTALANTDYDWSNIAHKRVFVIGHSLGGAAASILPMCMRIEPIRIYTFGAPKFLYKSDAWRYNLPLWRFVQTSDWVPIVPYFAYTSAGNVRYLNDAGISNTRSFVSRIVKYLKVQMGKSVEEHGIVNYHEDLARALSRE